MQTKTYQKEQLALYIAANDLYSLCWFGQSSVGGKDSVMVLANGIDIPVVPLIVSQVTIPVGDEIVTCAANTKEQTEFSRLIAETMCQSMRKKLKSHRDIHPALTTYAEIAALPARGDGSKYRWKEWEFVEMDDVCPHCGMINQQGCCTGMERPKPEPVLFCINREFDLKLRRLYDPSLPDDGSGEIS